MKTRNVVLVGMILFGFLIGLTVLSGFSRTRESMRRADCANDLKSLGLALRRYASEHQD